MGSNEDGFVIIPGGCLLAAVAIVGFIVLIGLVVLLVRTAWPVVLLAVVAALALALRRRDVRR